MAAELLFAPEVEWDVLEAYAWYEGRRSGLGEDFLTCVDACVQPIYRHPESYAVVYEGYRRAMVRRFPNTLSLVATTPTPSERGNQNGCERPAGGRQPGRRNLKTP